MFLSKLLAINIMLTSFSIAIRMCYPSLDYLPPFVSTVYCWFEGDFCFFVFVTKTHSGLICEQRKI